MKVYVGIAAVVPKLRDLGCSLPYQPESSQIYWDDSPSESLSTAGDRRWAFPAALP